MAKVVRDLLARVDRETQAWAKMCPEKKFSGFTVVQVQAAANQCREVRAEIKEQENNHRGAQKRRALCETELAEIERRLVLAVRGDDEFGEDSDLFGEMGFVPRSQRARRARRRPNGRMAATMEAASVVSATASPPPIATTRTG